MYSLSGRLKWASGDSKKSFFPIYFTHSNIFFPSKKFFDLKEGDAWKVIFKPALKENIREMIQKIKELEEQINAYTTNRWNKPLEDN